MIAKIETGLCGGCGQCVDNCPVEAISIVDKKAHVDADQCIGCGCCQRVCPNEVIYME